MGKIICKIAQEMTILAIQEAFFKATIYKHTHNMPIL